MLAIREQQIGFLEVIAYLASILGVVGTVLWDWNLNFILVLILLIKVGVTSAPLRDIRALLLLRRRSDRTRRPGYSNPSEKSLSYPQTQKTSCTKPIHRNDENRIDQPVEGITPATNEKGTIREAVDCCEA
jgi:hypothetical protein